MSFSAARLFLLLWTKTNSRKSKNCCEIFANKVLKACLGADSRLANTDAECAALTRGPTSETGIGVNDGKPGKVEAHDAAGRHLGMFSSQAPAVAAIVEACREWLKSQEQQSRATPKIPLQKAQQNRKKRQSGCKGRGR
jgi:hypothetical protein